MDRIFISERADPVNDRRLSQRRLRIDRRPNQPGCSDVSRPAERDRLEIAAALTGLSR
jgi:hypothetical protein